MKTVNPLPFLLLLAWLPCQAMDSDRDQPIEVEADRLELREQENVSIYEGNVKLVQGSLRISSERLVIHFNEANELTLMEMTGTPATLRQLDNASKELYGEAEQIDYSEADSLLIMRRKAFLDHPDNMIRGELIRLNTRTNGIEASGNEAQDRVRMIIKSPQKATAGDTESGAAASSEPTANE